MKSRKLVKLSATAIEKLKPEAAVYDCFDAEVNRLTIRVQPTGSKSYCVLYRVRGSSKLRRHTIGKIGVWTLDAARDRAREILQAAERGQDTTNKDPNRPGTFGALADAYLKGWAALRKRSAGEDERMLSMARIEPWNVRAAASITSADVRALLDSVAVKAPIAANRVRALLSKVFNFGIKRGLVAVNPVMATERPSPERERNRKFSESELRVLWLALNEEPSHIAAVFRLLLLTGCRKNEVAKLKQTEIEGFDWTLPAERSKNKRAYLIPLSPYALSLAKEIGRGFNVQSGFQRVVERSGLLDARIHDLRRSFGTYCGKLKIQPHVIDALLNHAPVTITRKHYNLYDYADEKREALVRWERYLIDDVIGGGKVVALTARA